MSADVFSFVASNGVELNQDMKRAKVKWATDDTWHFTNASFILSPGNVRVRVQGFRLGDAPVATTSEFVHNNTGLTFVAKINSESRALNCSADEDAPVSIKRTELTEGRVGGEISLTLNRCFDANTTEPINYDQLPITLEGRFSVKRK
ncbi:MAG: hypothetical protein AAF393_07085 [Pseudomonadota bacterium]